MHTKHLPLTHPYFNFITKQYFNFYLFILLAIFCSYTGVKKLRSYPLKASFYLSTTQLDSSQDDCKWDTSTQYVRRSPIQDLIVAHISQLTRYKRVFSTFIGFSCIYFNTKMQQFSTPSSPEISMTHSAS